MASNRVYGIIVLAVGLIIIGATLYLAYGLYGTFVTLAAAPGQQSAPLPTGNVSTTSGIVNAVINGVVASIPASKFFYYALALLALLLFANIGYKFAKIGMSMLGLGKEASAQSSAQKQPEQRTQLQHQPQGKNRF